jgi:hypothetical protein
LVGVIKMCALFLFHCVGPTNATRCVVVPWKVSVGCTSIAQLSVTIVHCKQPELSNAYWCIKTYFCQYVVCKKIKLKGKVVPGHTVTTHALGEGK